MLKIDLSSARTMMVQNLRRLILRTGPAMHFGMCWMQRIGCKCFHQIISWWGFLPAILSASSTNYVVI